MSPPAATTHPLTPRRTRATVLLAVATLTILGFHWVCPTDCPSQWNRVQVGTTTLHLHHWLLCVLALLVLTCVPVLRDSAVLAGLLVGGLVHGLTYPDWHVVVVRASST